MHKTKLMAAAVFLLLGPTYLFAQNISRQEMLRGSVTPEREWWDVMHYHLKVEFLPETKRLRGRTR